MKNVSQNIATAAITICLLTILLFSSCKKDFDEINDNPNSPKEISTGYLLTSAEKGLMDNTTDIWWNGSVGNLLAQYWAQNLYTDESQYQFRTEVTNKYWGLFYAGGNNDEDVVVGGLKELQEIIDRCTSDPEKYSPYGDPKNQIAVATILQVWCFQNITDTWGDIPFSEALNDVKNTQPKYNTQEEVYSGLLTKLDSASVWLDETQSAPQGDLIYNSDLSLWRKFLNSLKLRVAIRLADRNPSLSQQAISEAVSAGVFTSNSDNAVFNYIGSVPNVNPLYYDRYVKGRQDFSSTQVMVDLLDSLGDARIGYFYDTTRTAGLGYVGRPYGQSAANASTMPISSISQPSRDNVFSATSPGVYLDYAHVLFILAEAAERGFIGGDAETYYDQGIDASWEFWTGSVAPSGYHAQPDVNYSALKSAGKTWQTIIGRQKWIALYNQGIQGWTEWRRLDFDLLSPPVDGVLRGTGIPLRMEYPVEEQTLNSKNYNAAIANQGSDRLDTKMWWDVY